MAKKHIFNGADMQSVATAEAKNYLPQVFNLRDLNTGDPLTVILDKNLACAETGFVWLKIRGEKVLVSGDALLTALSQKPLLRGGKHAR